MKFGPKCHSDFCFGQLGHCKKFGHIKGQEGYIRACNAPLEDVYAYA